MMGILHFGGSLVIGLALGFLFFSGLWKTLQHLPVTRNPSILIMGSAIIRIGVVILGFFFLVMEGHWDRLMVGLLGFLVMRTFLVRRLGITSHPPVLAKS